LERWACSVWPRVGCAFEACAVTTLLVSCRGSFFCAQRFVGANSQHGARVWGWREAAGNFAISTFETFEVMGWLERFPKCICGGFAFVVLGPPPGNGGVPALGSRRIWCGIQGWLDVWFWGFVGGGCLVGGVGWLLVGLGWVPGVNCCAGLSLRKAARDGPRFSLVADRLCWHLGFRQDAAALSSGGFGSGHGCPIGWLGVAHGVPFASLSRLAGET